jgi:hypothetical protein
MINVFAVFKEAYKIATKDRLVKKEKDEKFKVAKAFNDRYSFYREYFDDKIQPAEDVKNLHYQNYQNYAWMCPDCNKIHRAVGTSVFFGLIFPACCSFNYGRAILVKKMN